MAEKDKKYYWLKLKRDFFKRHDIQIIEDMPNGKDYILFYLKLLCESVDHDGNLRFNEEIPYNEEMLSTITRTNIDTIRSAIKVFKQLKMIEILSDGTIYMREVNKMLGSETYWAERKRIQKERKNAVEELPAPKYPYMINNSTVVADNMIVTSNGVNHYIDEKRYGGNGKQIMAKYDGKCANCGNDEKVVIHHKNEYSNNPEDLVVLCKKCHGEQHRWKYSNAIPTSPSKSIDIEKDKDKELEKEPEKEKELLNKSSINEIFDRWMKELEKVVTEVTFDAFFTKLRWDDVEENRLIISGINSYSASIIENRYGAVMKEAISKASEGRFVDYVWRAE